MFRLVSPSARAFLGLFVVVFLAAAACSSSSEPEPVTAASAPRRQARAKAKPRPAPPPRQFDEHGLPAACAKKRFPCLPPPKWVESLCADVYPDVALHMFAPGTPWQRFYMLKMAEPFNASGGMSLMGDKMRRGEEVIALRRRNAGRHGMEMSDIGGYDVLRWNGACATVHDGEFALKPLPVVDNARIEWRSLGLPTRLLLEKDPSISETYEARRKSCQGIRLGRVSGDCEADDRRFGDEIVRYVRNGGDLPKPAKVP